MVKSSRGVVRLVCAALFLSSFSYAATPDRIQGPLAGGQKIVLRGNVHGLARPGSDIGRVDGNRLIQGVSLDFRPSPAQQRDLDQFIAQLGDRNSPNYHKYLTPKQFGERFGLSRNDIQKIKDWLQSEGFTNVRVANGRNRISFDGTIAQVEASFNTEFHHYLIDSELHFANATDISIPAAMAQAVIGMSNVNTFRPKPRARPVPHFTSSSSGNHFLTPGDFATIYGLQALYDAGIDGTGQKIAVVGQTDIIASDLDHFRSASNLTLKQPTKILVAGTGTPQVFAPDLVETDLDLEWAGGVAKNATIEYVYVGNNSNSNVWNSLQTAVSTQPIIAPFISTSYGFCEAGLGSTFATTVQSWAVEAISQGQTIVAASGDAGAADCESTSSTDGSSGLAVDVPASIPEVTGMGGNEFFGDASSTSDTTYWHGSSTGDIISSAISYIPEEAWNDTTTSISLGAGLSSSGGGASNFAGGFFAKPTWQTGTGVPNDGARDVPDVSLAASPNHDGYLFCSQPQGSNPPTCSSGFRDSGGFLNVVGGTSAGSPSFAAMLALVNQFLGNDALTGIAPLNPTLYGLASSNPAVFHDVITGDNKIPCPNPGTTGCPVNTSIGFTAGTGYDQVTGLGSVDGFALASALSTAPNFTLAAAPASVQVAQGSSVTVTVDLTALNSFSGPVTYSCTGNPSESTCTGPTSAVDSSQSASFVIKTTAATAKLEHPLDRGTKIFYATVFPGLLGLVFVAASGKRSIQGVRFLGLLLMLGFSTLWLASCGGSSSGPKDPGTPAGNYTITVKGVSGSLTRQTTFQLVVVK
jgi:subtilase family serine protease